MNLNLVDLSSNVKTEFKGQFNDVMTRTINKLGGTNINTGLLDGENKIMDNKEFIERARFILENKDVSFIGELASNADITEDKVRSILSTLINAPMEISNERGKCMRESFQIGDKIEINASGNGPNNYAGMLNSAGVIRELKAKVLDQQKLLKEKDERIAALMKTIELLEKR